MRGGGSFPGPGRANPSSASVAALADPLLASGHDGRMRTVADAAVAISGFVDHHTHLLTEAAGTPFPWQGSTVRAFHERVRRDGTTPMDVPETPTDGSLEERARRLYRGLGRAAAGGLVEITEMGMRHWWYLDALASLGERPLPARVRIYLASGLAERSVPAELDARRSECGPWVRLDGVKFYADGWLVPRTCAMCRNFDDEDTAGILSQDSSTLARRIERFAAKGWRIATHAIGDRAVEAVLDAYDMTWGATARRSAPPCRGSSTAAYCLRSLPAGSRPRVSACASSPPSRSPTPRRCPLRWVQAGRTLPTPGPWWLAAVRGSSSHRSAAGGRTAQRGVRCSGLTVAWCEASQWACCALGACLNFGMGPGQATFQLRSPSRATTSMLPPSAAT